ncbi:hypothetical protein RHSIM_Rhsim08G0138100 [Rhododendron simsii]|uniref:Uncharacterized protein n=1 Tax=Rhododendron simsii TaxID=118357 RepID=A0A834LDF2_RHOSS|nr:hypothetical protein RHSIM_Rhsim08G0138100 [Rhododendron simsii]
MGRKSSPSVTTTSGGSPKRLAIGLLDSVASLWITCAKKASRASRKLRVECRVAPGSPLTKPKKLLATISHRATHFRRKKRAAGEYEDEEFDLRADYGDDDGELWQRTILMGDKCQPLDFSGVIYYDSKGNQLAEVPMRSPRASPLPGYLIS